MLMASTSRNLLILFIALLPGLAAPIIRAQEIPDLEQISQLPIDLDAESSEFDRKKNRLFFRGLTIKQGPLSITADEATATRLDFENTRWEFNGNVIFENAGTTAYCDFADILFLEHRIRNAIMQGKPAYFEKIQVGNGRETEGRANLMEYDMDRGVISMSDNAWLSDGANEVSGNRISYDLNREFIIAAADDDGQVRMKIIPPESELPDIEDQLKP